jgi:hypothetical protein
MLQHLPCRFRYSRRTQFNYALIWTCGFAAVTEMIWLLLSIRPLSATFGCVILCLLLGGCAIFLGVNEWFCMSKYILDNTGITQLLPFGKTITIRWKDLCRIVSCELGIRGPIPAKSETRGIWKWRALVDTQGQFIVISNDIERCAEFEKIVVSLTGDPSIRWTKSPPSKSAKKSEDASDG